MRYYIAAPIFNSHQLKVVNDIKEMIEKDTLGPSEVFSPYHASREVWKGRAPKDCTPEERKRVLDGNIVNLHWCDVLVAWVGGTESGKTDTGVVWEMGYAEALQSYSHRKESPFTLAFIHPDDLRSEMNLMLAGTVDAVAHGLDALRDALQLLNYGAETRVREKYHPDSNIHHEGEKIG